MNELDTMIMAYIRDNPGCTNPEICEAVGMKTRGGDYQKIRRYTESLARFGFIDVMVEYDIRKVKRFTVKVEE